MTKLAPLFYFFGLLGIAQNPYPQDYFRNPLNIEMVLGGSFAELRSNHFHAGLDIKTQQRTGLEVFAAAEGYVSRIKISNYGYGKAIYITHPNGYTTVYAHLEKLAPKLQSYIKECQYQKESYEVEMFPSLDELPIASNELIAYSGNTGSSGGPHLHFEIRDNQERPINPMMFGLTVADSKLPVVTKVFAYTKGRNSHVNNDSGRVELRLIPKSNGDYQVEPVNASGTIGFGVASYDQQDMAYNKNGVSNIQTFYNGSKNFEMDFKRFSFAETKHINRFIDFEYYKTKSDRIQKLFVEPGNTLSMFKDISEDGYVGIEDSISGIYKIKISDYEGNSSWISIPIEGTPKKEILENANMSPDYLITANQSNKLEKDKVRVSFPANTFYDDFNINFAVHSDTLILHEDVIPLMKNYTITYDISNYNNADKDKLFIASLNGYYKRPSYISTSNKGDELVGYTKSLGTFVLHSDTTPPSIKPVNFSEGKWMSNQNELQVSISDDLSGISNYRATINGEWILMEYEYKKNLLTYDFSDGISTETENKLKVIVTDNVGNSSTFEATFFRK